MKKKQSVQRTLVIFLIAVFVIAIIFTGIIYFSPSVSPTPSGPGYMAPKTSPPVAYNQKAQQKLLNKFNNRQGLTQPDKAVKAKLLSLLPKGEQSGTIYQTADFKVDYVQAPDLFQVEIDTTNIALAKQAATHWLLQEGLSQQGLCNLPVQFYLNFDVMQSLRGQHVEFNPLAPGC